MVALAASRHGPSAGSITWAPYLVRAIRFFRFAVLPFQGRPLVVARSGWSKQGGFEIYLDEPSLGGALWDALWQAGEDLEVAPGCPNLIERVEGGKTIVETQKQFALLGNRLGRGKLPDHAVPRLEDRGDGLRRRVERRSQTLETLPTRALRAKAGVSDSVGGAAEEIRDR